MAAKNKTRAPYAGRLSAESVAQMVAHRQSGAAGIHADQHSRNIGALRSNRQSTRSARTRAAVQDSF